MSLKNHLGWRWNSWAAHQLLVLTLPLDAVSSAKKTKAFFIRARWWLTNIMCARSLLSSTIMYYQNLLQQTKKKSYAKSIREIFPTELSANLLKKVPNFEGPWVWSSTNRYRMFFIQTLHTSSKHAPTEHGRYYIQTSNSQTKLLSS